MSSEHSQASIAALCQQNPPQYPFLKFETEACSSLLQRYKNDVLVPCGEAISQCNFDQIGSLWMGFWSSATDSDRQEVANQPMADALIILDFIFLEWASSVLIPNVLSAVEPKLASNIREFAKTLPRTALQSADFCAPAYIEKKMEVVQLFSALIRCQTSLNHVAQAARAVLRSEKNVEQMMNDWEHVDFVDVERQVEWTSPEALDMMRQVHKGFEGCLKAKRELEEYTAWSESVIESKLPQTGAPASRVEPLEKLTVQWTFVMSLIMRDLTLRSATAFGNFHLFSLLFHESLMYIVECAKRDAMGSDLRQRIAPLL